MRRGPFARRIPGAQPNRAVHGMIARTVWALSGSSGAPGHGGELVLVRLAHENFTSLMPQNRRSALSLDSQQLTFHGPWRQIEKLDIGRPLTITERYPRWCACCRQRRPFHSPRHTLPKIQPQPPECTKGPHQTHRHGLGSEFRDGSGSGARGASLNGRAGMSPRMSGMVVTPGCDSASCNELGRLAPPGGGGDSRIRGRVKRVSGSSSAIGLVGSCAESGIETRMGELG